MTRFALRSPSSNCQLANRSSCARARRPSGLTIVEVMIAIAITLVLLGVLIRLFTYSSGEITKGRAIIELSGQLRMTSDQLRHDLSGLTCPTRPWTNAGDGLGYFEYLEGFPHRDDPTVTDTTIGDIDDVLMFTARSSGRPFRGRYWPVGAQPTIIESDLAEICWWTVLDDQNGNGIQDTGEQLVLRRRVLLIRPDLNDTTTRAIQINSNNLVAFYERNDISVRPSANGLAANSLADLSRRENRFAHFIGYQAPIANPGGPNFPPVNDPVQLANDLVNSFPHGIDRFWLNQLTLRGNYQGEDVILSSLLAFDVKIYDPNALVYDDRITSTGSITGVGTIPLNPTDPGYFNELQFDFNNAPAGLSSFIGRGAFVDLGYQHIYTDAAPVIPGFPKAVIAGFPAVPNMSQFSGLPQLGSQLGAQLAYSTWPTSYESDGIDQDGVFSADQGTNGIDDNAANGTDDAGERETSPPYPFPMRGLQVSIRVVEPDTQQVDQTTVVQNFIPE